MISISTAEHLARFETEARGNSEIAHCYEACSTEVTK